MVAFILSSIHYTAESCSPSLSRKKLQHKVGYPTLKLGQNSLSIFSSSHCDNAFAILDHIKRANPLGSQNALEICNF